MQQQQEWQQTCQETWKEAADQRQPDNPTPPLAKLEKQIQDYTQKSEKRQEAIQKAVTGIQQESQAIKKSPIAASQTTDNGQTIDFSKIQLPKGKEHPIRRWIVSIWRFKINAPISLALLVAAGVAGLNFKQQEILKVFGGENNYDLGRLLIAQFPENEKKLSECITQKLEQCPLQIKVATVVPAKKPVKTK